jgi:hypothetical protein
MVVANFSSPNAWQGTETGKLGNWGTGELGNWEHETKKIWKLATGN